MSRCRDLVCQHLDRHHEPAQAEQPGKCQRCPCDRFRFVIPRHQQLQGEFSKMIAAGETFVDWLTVPDPTAERKPSRGIETVGYL